MKRIIAIVAVMAALIVFADETEIVKIKGRGSGADKTEALKDAYRDAVERAVGQYVDAEQMMKNEKLVEDQILTQSNAYIEKYDVVKENVKPNGFVEIQILAQVRKIALKKKISDVMPTKTFMLGGELKNVHAKITTTARRNVDGAALLKKALDGFDPLALVADCELASPKSVIRELSHPLDPKDKIAVNYLFRTGINQNRYSESVVPKLKEVLAQISLSEPRAVTMPIRMGNAVDVEAMVVKGQQSSGRLQYLHDANAAPQVPSQFNSALLEGPKSDGTVGLFVLVTGVNKYRTSISGVRYELDESSQAVADKWVRTASPEFIATIIDAAGETIGSRKIKPHYAYNWCVSRRSMGGFSRKNRRYSYVKVVIVAPFGCDNSGFVFEDYTWHEFVIPKDALTEVQDMKIELAQ